MLSESEKVTFKYSSRGWEMAVMLPFLFVGTLLGAYLGNRYQSSLAFGILFACGLFLPCIFLRYMPRLFGLTGSCTSDDVRISMQLQFHRIDIEWTTVTSIEFVPSRGDRFHSVRYRGLNIHAKGKSVNLYAVDETLSEFYQILSQQYESRMEF